MVYEVHHSMVETWYAGFTREGAGWRVLLTSGIARAQFLSLLRQDVLLVRP